MRGIAIFALTATWFLSACGGEAIRVGPIDQRELRALEAVHVDPAGAAAMLTAYRRTHGLGPVRLDPTLTAIAQRQADAMVAANALSHKVIGDLAARLAGGGVNAPEAGENIGGGYYSTGEAMNGWRNSPEHNANLLLPNATRFGIALAKNPRTTYRTYWAMEVAAEASGSGDSALMMAPALSGR
jgi:Cysteine-rich secretory protein family